MVGNDRVSGTRYDHCTSDSHVDVIAHFRITRTRLGNPGVLVQDGFVSPVPMYTKLLLSQILTLCKSCTGRKALGKSFHCRLGHYR